MPDIFGYNNPVKMSGAIASTDFASISTDGKLSLVQNLSATYQQQVQEVAQVGDPSVYWLPGRPSGSIDVSKLVGDQGFFNDWKGKACGKINAVNVSTKGSMCGFNGTGSLTFTGGVIESLSLSMAVGQMTISESARIRVANLSAVS